MLLRQIINCLLRISPSNQVVNGEPSQDVEKDTQQFTENREMAYNNRLIAPSGLASCFKANENGLKHTLFKELPILSSYQNRGLPIISGILIPFSILLSIPSLTDRWYIRTDANNVTVETRPNPFLLSLGMGFGMACGVLANVCLIVRFSERNVLKMTWLCILFLTLHDLINILMVTIFGVQHRFNDGFTYGQSFWFAICSTIASTATNITLIVDYARTKDFANSGSGLTDKQRSLVIIIIVLLCYVAFGSLIQTFMLKISFIDAIYFCVVSIETIGFGDLHPTSAGSRIFNSFYIAGGMLNLALAVALIREVLLEGVVLGFQTRVKAIHARQRERRIRARWRTAIKLRLRANNLPMWVMDSDGENDEEDWQYHHHHHWWRWAKRSWDFLGKRSREPSRRRSKRKHLNLRALSEAQMEDAALEAGAPLADLLPPGLQFTSLATTGDDMEGEDDEEPISDRGGVSLMQSMTMQDEAILEDTVVAEEKAAFFARLAVALLVFIVFWMAGSVIFMTTEKWDFGTAAYFCKVTFVILLSIFFEEYMITGFIAFTTVGYGDFSPQTPAGRSIFIAWALLGVATMTILISILVEAYSRQFKNVIRTDDGVNTTHVTSGTRQIRFLDSPGRINAGTKEELISPGPLSASFTLASSSTTGRRDWEPSVVFVQENGSQKLKKESMESLHEILRHAQILRSLIPPENWLDDGNLNGSRSNTADLKTPQASDIRGPGREIHKVCQIEKSMQEIITAARCALEVLDGENLQ